MVLTYAIFCCAALLLVYFLVSSRRKGTPPLVFVWNPIKLIWLARLYRKDTMTALQEARKQCGDTFRIHLLTRVVYFSFDVANVKKFVTNTWARKLDFYNPTSANISSLINVDKAVKPYKTQCSQILYDSDKFLTPSISHLADEMQNGFSRVASLQTSNINICETLENLLFCSLLRVIIGKNHTKHAMEFRKHMTVVTVGLNNPWVHISPQWWPWGSVREFRDSKCWLLDEIGKSLQNAQHDGSYLSRIALGGLGLGHDAMHVFAMLYGANVNTIPTAVIAAVLLSLPEHAHILKDLRSFLKSPQSDVYSDFNLLDQILEETLRLYPVRVLTRVTTDHITDVGGYIIPRGSWFLLSPYLLHRYEQVYDEPDKFNPARWTKGLEKKMRLEGKYISFGFGEHQCLGMRLARVVFKTFLSELFSNYQLHMEATNKYKVIYYSKKRGFQHPILGRIKSI